MTQDKTQPANAARCSVDPEELQQAVNNMVNDFQSRRHNPYTHRVEDPRERFAMLTRLIEERGVRYAHCDLDNFAVDGDEERGNVVARLTDFIDNMPERLTTAKGGLILLGPWGTGKDHLIMSAMKAAILRYGFRVRWVDGLEMLADVKAAIETHSTTTLVDQLSQSQILVISDPVPPRDELKPYELSIIRRIVEKRYSAMRATWITTNVQTADDAARLLSGPVLSRLVHGALELFCGWESHRRPFGH